MEFMPSRGASRILMEQVYRLKKKVINKEYVKMASLIELLVCATLKWIGKDNVDHVSTQG